MPLNKFFDQSRKDFGNKRLQLDTEFPMLFQNANDMDIWNKTGDALKKEQFVIKAISETINDFKTEYRIAKNAIGDILVEFKAGSYVVISITNSKIVSIFSSVTLTEEAKRALTLKGIIAYQMSVTPNFLDDISSFYSFVETVRDEIHSRKTSDFMKSDGTMNVLDLTSGLPFTTNMIAQQSVDTSDNEIKIFLPQGSDFQNFVVADNNTLSEVGEFKTFDEITSFNVTPDRVFTIDEQVLMAENADNAKGYILTPAAKDYLEDFYDLYKANLAPTSCAFYGPSGAGKTVMAQVIARELHRPYVAFKMRENSDEDSLRGSIKNIADKDNGGEITYEDSPIVKALKYGYVCEVQELSVCTNQGAETFFNPILDRTKTFEDASGKTFSVHPDALIIFTYNPDYCENNQIATSLLNRIDDNFRCEFPDKQTVINILIKQTGYSNMNTLDTIYELCFGDGSKIGSIREKLKEEDAEEEISIRQVCNWIKRYTNCRRYYNQKGGWVNAAMHTIVQSLGQREPELQNSIVTLIEAVF